MAQQGKGLKIHQATINDVYTPTGEEAEVRQMVYERFRQMKESSDRKSQELRWDKATLMWEAERTVKNPKDWQSNHYVPLTTAIIETALAEIAEQSPEPLILPHCEEDEPRAKIMQEIFKYSLHVSDFDTEYYNITKDALTYGTGIGQEYYFRDPRKISIGGKEEEVYDYDDCYLECVRLRDFYVDERARAFSGPYAARDAIRRYIMNIDDFNLFFSGKVWDPLGNAKLVRPGGDTNYYEHYKPPEGMDHSKDLEVLWYWSTKPKDKLVVVANDIVIVNGPNPYKHKQLPFVRMVDVKRNHHFYGKGEADILESVNDEMNTLRRMVIDRNHLDIDKMFLVSSNLQLNDEDLLARPHGMIPTDDVNAAKPIEYGDIPRSVEMSIEMLNNDATIVTGIDPRAESLPQGGTATEAAILKESALKRIRMKLLLAQREFLIPFARLRVSNILQFYSQPRLEQIVGNAQTQEYKTKMQQLQQQGAVTTVDGKPYQMKFREMRLKDRALDFNPTNGSPYIKNQQGFNFFELKPEFFMPVARGGYEIDYEAGSTLPISRPLQQSKITEMYDRLIQLAVAGVGYDPVKLGDQLLEVNDLNPEDFKSDQQPTTGGALGPPQPGGGPPAGANPAELQAQQQADLAEQENQQMANGQDIPATPYASPVHTQVHTEFMHSPTFQQLPPEVDKIIMAHVAGEMMEQTGRGQAQMTPQMAQMQAQGKGGQLPPRPQTQVPPEAGKKPLVGDMAGGNKQLQATIPALIQGGGQTPHGI